MHDREKGADPFLHLFALPISRSRRKNYSFGRAHARGSIAESLMARVGPAEYVTALQQPHDREMDFTGKPMKGYVYVGPAGIESDADLRKWIRLCMRFNKSLPAK